MILPERTVYLDVQGAQNWTHLDRGIPRYVVEHIRALQRLCPAAIAAVLLNPRLPVTGNLSWLLGSGLFRWSSDDPTKGRLSGGPPWIYHVMSPFELNTRLDAIWPTWARRSGVATVVTLYDLIPLIFSEHYLRDPGIRAAYEARLGLVRHADQVLAISQNTADDAVERLGIPDDRVHVINAGAVDHFATLYESEEAAWDQLRNLGSIRPGFILYVGGFDFRKNLDGLIAGYARVASRLRAVHQLVIACRMLPDQMRMLHQLRKDLGIQGDELVLTGYVTDDVLGALYRACDLFVFPSLYEGSGLPVLEAMSCGAAVAASTTSTGPELLGDCEGTFDPRDPDGIAACLTYLLTTPATLERLRRRSRRRVADYTWRHVAQRTNEAYERAIVRGPSRRSRRWRIAFITPWLPEKSGIAGYNLRLAAELGRRIDVDVVVRGTVEEYPSPVERGIRLVGGHEFGHSSRPRHYDRLVFCMGNSEFHGYIYELLKQHQGPVVLHDVQLTGFYGWYAGVEHPAASQRALLERIKAMYGDRLPPEAIGDEVPSWDRQRALGIYMTREVQRYATECFVHSQLARDVLVLDRAPGDRGGSVGVLPFGMPAAADAPRGAAGQRPLIVSLGYVSETKGLTTLIRAFARLRADLPTARLVIAGPMEQPEFERWKGHAHEEAPGSTIEFTGYVSAQRYSELLRTADLAVQLRLVSNGEASAAVADCLASGLPTIVTDLGWAGELPDGSVERVPLDVRPGNLAARMLHLLTDTAARVELSERALRHAREMSFANVAEAYLDALGLC